MDIKGIKFSVENPTRKQKRIMWIFNCLLWVMVRLLKHDEEKMHKEIVELFILFRQVI